MTSSPTDDSETKNPPTLGESSIPVTPKNPNSSPQSYSSFESPKSPLFSREDQIEIHRKRRQLEMDIIALEHQEKILQTELQTIKQNVVSQGELTYLKAQTRSRIAENQSNERTHLIDDYVETMRCVRAAEASIAVLEQKIKEESERRNYILEEGTSVLNSLDFSDIKFTVPKITGADPTYNPSTKYELDRKVLHLQDTNGTYSSLEKSSDLLPLQANVAKAMTKSLEIESTLRSIGTAAIRQEIQINQKLIASQETQLRKFEAENDKKKELLDKRKDEMNAEIVYHETQFGLAKESFKQQIQQLDDETNSLKARITDSAVIFDRIVDETKVVLSKIQNRATITEEESEDDDVYEYQEYSKSGVSYDYTQSSAPSLLEDEEVLQARKKQLIEEIDEMNDKIKDMKRKGLKKELEMKAKITAMNERYKANKAKLQGFNSPNHNLSNSGSSSSLSKSLEVLISKIDNSLNELKSDLQ